MGGYKRERERSREGERDSERESEKERKRERERKEKEKSELVAKVDTKFVLLEVIEVGTSVGSRHDSKLRNVNTPVNRNAEFQANVAAVQAMQKATHRPLHGIRDGLG